MTVPGRAEVEAAGRLLTDRVRRTPVLDVEPGLFAPVPVVLKLEQHQHTGSFKVRGAFVRALSGPVPPAGLITASGGNAGLAAAYVGARLGHHVEVHVPLSAPPVKVGALRTLGATVVQEAPDYAGAAAACLDRQRRSGALLLHAYDQPEVLAGQGTVALELSTQAASVDTVLVAVGGGGLAGGIAAFFGGDTRVVGVEPEGCATWAAALAAGGPVDVAVSGVAVDSLGARRLGGLAWEALTRHRAASVVVPAGAVTAARKLLWSALRIAAEPGGAVAAAALSSGAYVPSRGERVAVVICGGNADPVDLG